MQESTVILVTESWPLSGNNNIRGHGRPTLHRQPKASIQAKARFDAKQNVISDKVATQLLHGLDPGSSTYVQFMAIRWRGSVSDQSPETTHLKVVPNMECDFILFSSSFSDYPDKKFAQEWFQFTTPNPLGSVSDPLILDDDEELVSDKGYNDVQQCLEPSIPRISGQEPASWDSHRLSNIQTMAASHGIHFMNLETVEALAPLWSQPQSSSQPAHPTNTVLERDTQGEDTCCSDSCVWDSSADAGASDFDPDWSASTSQRTLCAACPDRLLSCKTAQASPQLRPGAWTGGGGWPPMLEALMESGSTGGTTLASGSSDNSAPDEAILFQGERSEEVSKGDDIMFDQSQLREFEDHPGHKVWEWDPKRERWRRRGGTTEADWFPDFFA